MDAELAAVFFCLVLGISVDRIQASSSSTITGSLPSSPSISALSNASSTENTSSVFRAPSSPVSAISGSVNSTDLSTTTSPSSSWIVNTSRSIAINTTTSSLKSVSVNSALTTTQTISSLSFSSTSVVHGIVMSSFNVSSSQNTQPDSTSNSMTATMLTSSVPPLSLSVHSSLKNVSVATSTTFSKGPRVHTVSPSLSSVTTEGIPGTSTTVASISRKSTVSSITAASFTTSNGILSTLQSKSGGLTKGSTTGVVNNPLGSLSASASTILTSSTRVLSPSQTTSSSSLSSPKRTVSSSESPSLSETRGTLASTRIYATLSERLSSYPASTPATHTSSPRPTIPPEGTKMVNMEVTLNMEFREDYNDVNSPVYKELVANLSKALFRVYQEVDGFVGVQVLFIRRGSIVCNYIVILASNSKVTDDDLKKELHEGRKDGKFPFDVKGIAVIEDSDAVAAKTKLPQWAMTTMIVLGALSFCFLVIAICACIKYRNAMSSENYIYDVPPGKLDMRAYDAISMGHMRANVDGNTSTAQRRLVSSHENPTYGS